jgi:ABC-type uncharacterized transport system permease subunit
MEHAALIFAFHAYAVGAVLYLLQLARASKVLVVSARLTVGLGWLAHGAALAHSLFAAAGLLLGLRQGLSGLGFLLMGIALFVDLRYRAPVLGSFLVPAALLVLTPSLLSAGVLSPATGKTPLLPVHIAVALLGMAAFGVAAAVACLYLLLERQVKSKHFGLLFSRLPSLQFLDELNRQLVLVGFIALSVTAVTGALFARGAGFWAWDLKGVVTLLAWAVFAGLLNARIFAGWRGRRVALLTVGGFGAVTLIFFTSYLPFMAGGS